MRRACIKQCAVLRELRGIAPGAAAGEAAVRLSEERVRDRAFRRHQTESHMWRRLKEDRNQHYNDLSCACWRDPKAMARFKEQPQVCSLGGCCGNPRNSPFGTASERMTMQERRSAEAFRCALVDA